MSYQDRCTAKRVSVGLVLQTNDWGRWGLHNAGSYFQLYCPESLDSLNSYKSKGLGLGWGGCGVGWERGGGVMNESAECGV